MTDIEQIYRLYFSDVRLYLLSLCRDEHMADELVSDTFFKAMSALDGFRGQCSLRVWLCQIGKNCYYTRLRRDRRLLPLPAAEELPDNRNDPDDIIRRLSAPQEAARIYALLHDLEEPYKEVFTLRALGELSFSRIGELFGKTANWACVTYHRAKNKIKEQMEDEL